MGSKSALLLGDPHLGRRFEKGVPKHRAGEREASVELSFWNSINKVNADYHICMGDIFDKRIVNNGVIIRTAHYYRLACEKQPHVQFVLIEGNHDVSRDADSYSSFDILVRLLEGVPNFHAVCYEDGPMLLDGLAFFPFDPFKDAQAVVQELFDVDPSRTESGTIHAAFGHWDLDEYGTKIPNLCPAGLLFTHTSRIYTGHVHTPEVRDFGNGKTLVAVGSMQPYSFGEDPTGIIYQTLTLAELLSLPPEKVKDKALRVVLEEGEELPTDIDCLQIVAKKAGTSDDLEDLEVKLLDFDLNDILLKELTEAGVTDMAVVADVQALFAELKEEQNAG